MPIRECQMPLQNWLNLALFQEMLRKTDIALNRSAVENFGNGDASGSHITWLLLQFLHPMLLVIDNG